MSTKSTPTNSGCAPINMKIIVTAIIIVAVVVIGGLAISNNTAAPTEQEARLEKAPNFSLQDYNGKTVSLADFAGKPLVLNAWATWCPFCREELPAFAAVQKEFNDKVFIIAIDRAESLGVVKGYTDQQGTTDNLMFLLDPSDSFYQSIGGFSMPETIFVDAQGVVRDHKRGPMKVDEIRARINKILQ